MFHSLRGKFLAVCLGSLCVLGLAMGVVGTTMLLQVSERNEVESIHRTAEVYRGDLDEMLVQAEDTADFAAAHLRWLSENGGTLVDVKSGQQDSVARLVQKMFAEIPEVRAYYACDASAIEKNDGIWFTRTSPEGALEARSWQQLSDFLPNGASTPEGVVGDTSDRQGIWLRPFYSPAQDAVLISYVRPVHRDGVFIGFVGVDLDFAGILGKLRERTVYDTGFAFLAADEGATHYSVDEAQGVRITQPEVELVQADVTQAGDSTNDLQRYDVGGTSYDSATSKLRNGMSLVVTAPTDEVHAEARAAIYRMVLIFAWCFVIAAALMIVLTNRLARLYPMTFHDGLTGILNRLGLDHELGEWLKTAGGRPAILMTLDIDDFKLINDLQGHAAGDEALRALAQRLSSFFGKDAIVGRQGGDEFMVLLKETTADRADELLRELTAHAQSYAYHGAEKAFTISLGYASYPEHGKTLRTLAHHADAALYATKSGGKNGFSRYAAEQETGEQHAFSLRDLSERLPGAILVHQADGRILYANDALVQLFGCASAEEFRTFSEVSFPTLLHPDDCARAQAALRAQLAAALDASATTHCRIRTKAANLAPSSSSRGSTPTRNAALSITAF